MGVAKETSADRQNSHYLPNQENWEKAVVEVVPTDLKSSHYIFNQQDWGKMVTPDSLKKISAFEYVKDNPDLPRVLLIGDSISIQYTTTVRELLKDKANVYRIPTNGSNTTFTLENIDKWLGDVRWDVIHFNWGLHDLLKGPAVEAYGENLQKLIDKMKATGATLIWASTTPVPSGCPHRKLPMAELSYNGKAMEIVGKNRIRINDLHSFCLPRLKVVQRPNDVHLTSFGAKIMGGEVACHILIVLQERTETVKQ
jgi:acyl-CoA thioesterase-1